MNLRRAAVLAMVTAGLWACPPKGVADSGPEPMDGSQDIPDASCTPPEPAACVDEGNEDCGSCWAQIGRCCYGDATILGRAAPLTTVCRAQPSCASCCNECAAMSCDDLRGRNLCPNPEDTWPDAGTGNGWTSNGIAPLQALAATLLTDSTLDEQRFNDLLATDDERTFIHYLVQCALPAGASVKTMYGTTPLVFEGYWGLAPQWATAPCDTACREWVSACMFARNSYYGIPVAISIRGPHPSLAVGADEARIASVEEGAFFGDMFADTEYGWACRGHGDDPISTVVRRCTFANPGAGFVGAPASCWFFKQGTACDSVCDRRGDAGELTECHGTLPDGGMATFSRVITVYLKHNGLGALPADAGCQ